MLPSGHLTQYVRTGPARGAFVPQRKLFHRGTALLAITLWQLSSAPLLASSITNSDQESILRLKGMSLDELLNEQVTTVSKFPETMFDAAAAVQVINAEDIRRSKATTLPEALRLASNLQVAQFNAHDWAITARGFNGAPLGGNASLADKLLVMIDGRSVYTPLFAGVFWDVQNVLLEDVDRIEVVSGPGGTLWGANAVNGVINVVTKSARDTQGLYVSGAAGSFLQDFGALRYGGSVGTNLFYRVYAQRFDYRNTTRAGGVNNRDDWEMTQGGFRADYLASPNDTLTLQGDFYSGGEGDPTTVNLDGQNVLARWKRVLADESDLQLQAYFDRTWRSVPSRSFSDELTTYDVEFQHRFPLGSHQLILWGTGFRWMEDDVANSPSLAFSPARRDFHLFSSFVQDTITLVEEKLKLTLGSKLEHNDFTDWEVEPNVRLAWTPDARHTIWSAVSRAVRTPSRLDADVTTPLVGTDEFKSETVIAYELGYRVRPVPRLLLSVAGFFNDYDELRGIVLLTSPTRFVFVNGQRADTWGLEFSSVLQATDWWRFRCGYTYLQEEFSSDANIIPGSDTFEAIDPTHQVLLQSTMDLPGNFQLDLTGRYVDELPASALRPGGTITLAAATPAYFTFDARLGWRWKNIEIDVVGRNLAEGRHSELGANQIPRSVFGQITLRF